MSKFAVIVTRFAGTLHEGDEVFMCETEEEANEIFKAQSIQMRPTGLDSQFETLVRKCAVLEERKT